MLLFTIIFFENSTGKVYSFGAKGPYLHSTITADSILRAFENQSYEPNFLCSSRLWYYSGENDYKFAKDPSYHCDNSNFSSCSWRLNQLIEKASSVGEVEQALRYTGMSLHIVQDFYSHSNWVEIHNFSYKLADVNSYRIVPPPASIQSGYFPDLFLESPQAQVDCYFKDHNAIKSFIFGATHDCLNKDSNFTKRGKMLAENSAMTLHELAAEYAIRHSAKIIESIFDKSIVLKTCFVPKTTKVGCSAYTLKSFESTVH